MKTLKTDQPLVDLKNEILKENGVVVTIGMVLANLLSGTTNNPHRAYQLARTVSVEKKVELKAEDVVYLKEILSTAKLGALYIGQCIEILETNDKA